MAEKILIMGLSGSGKTYLASLLKKELEESGNSVNWFNGDTVRTLYNDWDFSIEGRLRQSLRMYELAEKNKDFDYIICDFIAPLQEMRENFEADWTIWMHTVLESSYKDTDMLFEDPYKYDFKITVKDAENWAKTISNALMTTKRDWGYKGYDFSI